MDSLLEVKVFISYAREDEALCEEFEKHLFLLKSHGIIQTWHHGKLIPGQDVEAESIKNLDSADIIVLLLSVDFLNSFSCYDVHLRKAMQRHHAGAARIIPVSLRWADYSGTVFDRIKCLPSNGKSVKNWQDRDAAWTEVAQEIRLSAHTRCTRPLTSIPIKARPSAIKSFPCVIRSLDVKYISNWDWNDHVNISTDMGYGISISSVLVSEELLNEVKYRGRELRVLATEWGSYENDGFVRSGWLYHDYYPYIPNHTYSPDWLVLNNACHAFSFFKIHLMPDGSGYIHISCVSDFLHEVCISTTKGSEFKGIFSFDKSRNVSRDAAWSFFWDQSEAESLRNEQFQRWNEKRSNERQEGEKG